MLDLDRYINDREEVLIFGKTVHVKEPTVAMYSEIAHLESDMDRKNMGEKRLKTAVIFLSNNEEGINFTEEQLREIPYAALDALTKRIAEMREKVEKDPNSESRSRKGK